MLITIYQIEDGWRVIVEGGGQSASGEYSYNSSVILEKGNYMEALQAASDYADKGDEVRVNQLLENFKYFS